MTLDEQRQNARDCWALAIAELRRQAVREGRAVPTEDERREMAGDHGDH